MVVSDDCSEDVPKMSEWESLVILIRGNLGPGCLNLPYAFARTGWALGIGLMVVVSVQGMYCMWLLARCKKIVGDDRIRTFTDLAIYSMGLPGRLIVDITLIAIQGGVCCVYVRLIATNAATALGAAGFSVSDFAALVGATVAFVPVSLFRFIAQLKCMSYLGNFSMLIAVFTVIVYSSMTIATDGTAGSMPASHRISDIFDCLSSLFFAFEGLGLVMPVENGMRRPQYFPNIMFLGMGTLSLLFISVGALASLAFPDIGTGSVTAFLVDQNSYWWFQFVNVAVSVAVFLTFPLQLFPAVEVVVDGLERRRARHANHRHASVVIEATTSEVAVENQHDPSNCRNEQVLLEDASEEVSSGGSPLMQWVCDKQNLVRVTAVLMCAVVAGAVENVGLLVSLVGAVGQTGLVMLPSIIHLQLQRLGLLSTGRLSNLIDVVVLIFCLVVMVFGTVSAVSDIIAAQS